MTREQREPFTQDRLGNVNRKIDPIRGLTGMEEEDGLVEIEEGEEGEPMPLMQLPTDSDGFYLEEVHAFNAGEDNGHFKLVLMDVDEDGESVIIEDRSTRMSVASGVTRSFSYTGKEFSSLGEYDYDEHPQMDGAIIAVESQFPGDIGIGGYMDRKESVEPESEQLETPSS